MLSRGRVKTDLFENADVTAKHRFTTYHAHVSLGITRGHFAGRFFLSKFECRSLHVAASSCGRGSFQNAPRVDADILYIFVSMFVQRILVSIQSSLFAD